jgi:hypothetical protein
MEYWKYLGDKYEVNFHKSTLPPKAKFELTLQLNEYFIRKTRNYHTILELILNIDNTAEEYCTDILKDPSHQFNVTTVAYVS